MASDLEAARLAFLLVAIWWAVFSIPLLLCVREDRSAVRSSAHPVADGLRQLRETLVKIRSHRQTLIFLAAYWLYIDGVDTIVRMAVAYGLDIGLPQESLIIALLMVQFIGFPAALLFGYLGELYGAKLGIWVGIWAYVAVTIFAYFMESTTHMYILAAVIGLVQGGIQALSRSMFSQLIPQNKTAEFFGFYLSLIHI